MIRRALLLCVLSLTATAGPDAGAAKPGCRPLDWEKWDRSPLLEVHVATTCEYRLTWTGWSPPRDYVYRPDADGWVSDYFITGENHGQVYWNVRTNAVVVHPREGMPLDLDGAKRVAQWAKLTNFPPLDLTKFDFSPGPVH